MGTLKANPDKSYAFFGSPGAGKTVVSTALYSEMLFRQFMRPHPRWKWFPVRRISVNKMLDQHAEYAIRRNDPDWTDLDRTLNAPDVTADKIRAVTQTGDKYRLFLEDMNGGDVTLTSRAILFEVVNALYENEGQLVITSNLTPAEFKRQYGEDLFWRIAKHCTVVNLFDEDKK
jgi:DNA replication protein DnaC